MNTAKRIYNVSAGPATLPEAVLEQAQRDLWSLGDTGVGILEHSHRSTAFAEILERTEADCRRLASISEDYAVLFLHGGATQQFATVPMSFLPPGGTSDMVHTGSWTKKAINMARCYGDVHLAFDGASCDFDHVPSGAELTPSASPAYTWYCSNNTIRGTQFQAPPTVDSPLVGDFSSDIFSRPVDVSAHAMILASAQKNLGPAGCTLVIADRAFLDTARDGLPAILDYRKHDERGSRLNTPPTFAIYVMGLVFRWILDRGGLEAVAEVNRRKAQVLYDAIERSGGFYRAVARPGSRSMMNVTFRTPSAELDTRFVAEGLEAGFSGLNGHRSVGGLRASIYNSFPEAGCSALAELMDDFAARQG